MLKKKNDMNFHDENTENQLTETEISELISSYESIDEFDLKFEEVQKELYSKFRQNRLKKEKIKILHSHQKSAFMSLIEREKQLAQYANIIKTKMITMKNKQKKYKEKVKNKNETIDQECKELILNDAKLDQEIDKLMKRKGEIQINKQQINQQIDHLSNQVDIIAIQKDSTKDMLSKAIQSQKDNEIALLKEEIATDKKNIEKVDKSINSITYLISQNNITLSCVNSEYLGYSLKIQNLQANFTSSHIDHEKQLKTMLSEKTSYYKEMLNSITNKDNITINSQYLSNQCSKIQSKIDDAENSLAKLSDELQQKQNNIINENNELLNYEKETQNIIYQTEQLKTDIQSKANIIEKNAEYIKKLSDEKLKASEDKSEINLNIKTENIEIEKVKDNCKLIESQANEYIDLANKLETALLVLSENNKTYESLKEAPNSNIIEDDVIIKEKSCLINLSNNYNSQISVENDTINDLKQKIAEKETYLTKMNDEKKELEDSIKETVEKCMSDPIMKNIPETSPSLVENTENFLHNISMKRQKHIQTFGKNILKLEKRYKDAFKLNQMRKRKMKRQINSLKSFPFQMECFNDEQNICFHSIYSFNKLIDLEIANWKNDSTIEQISEELIRQWDSKMDQLYDAFDEFCLKQ